jgi:hypothetical protein
VSIKTEESHKPNTTTQVNLRSTNISFIYSVLGSYPAQESLIIRKSYGPEEGKVDSLTGIATRFFCSLEPLVLLSYSGFKC